MGLAAPAGRGRLGRQRLHAGCATSSRRVGWGVRGHVAQWRPQTRGLFGCGGLELRPFPTHTCFRRLGKLPSHRRAVGPHRPVLRGVPRRPRHRVGRAPEVQPLPGVEPLLRRQPRARPRAEDPNSCCSTCPNPNCGPRCGGGCSRSSSCTPWPAPSTTGSGAASALARSTTQVNACSCLTLIDPRLHHLLAGQGDLTDCRRTGLPVRPRPASSCQPDRVESGRYPPVGPAGGGVRLSCPPSVCTP